MCRTVVTVLGSRVRTNWLSPATTFGELIITVKPRLSSCVGLIDHFKSICIMSTTWFRWSDRKHNVNIRARRSRDRLGAARHPYLWKAGINTFAAFAAVGGQPGAGIDKNLSLARLISPGGKHRAIARAEARHRTCLKTNTTTGPSSFKVQV